MKPLYATSLDILSCDPVCVRRHLLPSCFNQSGSQHHCYIKHEVQRRNGLQAYRRKQEQDKK